MLYKLGRSDHLAVLKIVAIYSLFGALWIYFSDTVLGWLVHDPVLWTKIAIYKGLMFILLTASLLYGLIYRHVCQAALSRKQVEASEERMRLYFERQLVGMAIVSPGKGFLQINDKFCQLLGYSREEMMDLSWEQITHPDDLYESNLFFSRLLSGEIDDYSIEKRFLHKEGSVVYTDLSVGCVRRRDGAVDYVLSLVMDITERKMAEAALRQSAETFSKAFNSSPIMMMISDPLDGTYLDVNRKFSELSGHSAGEAIGNTPVQLNWMTAGEWERIRQELELTGNCSGLEIGTRTRDGRLLECVYYGEPISVNGKGELLSIMLDVTEHRKLERQLRHALKMESIGRLAGGVAHDFNNKLAIILGYAEMAKLELSEDSSVWQSLEEISRAALHSRDITRQLLVFSRQDIIAPKSLNLNDAILDSQKILSRLIGEDITLSFQPGEDLWTIKIDPAHVDQIVMNLAVNARDAMPDGGTLRISTSNLHITEKMLPDVLDAKIGDYVCISFVDTGVGMDQDTLRNIFEPFFTTKEVGKGTGLGLSTIYGIVTQNSGFIDVSTAQGKGTTFNIYLPRLVEGGVTESPAEDGKDCGHGKVLLVEDDESVRKMIAQMLSRLGYQVTEVGSAREAADLCMEARAHPDIVLSDVIMPGLSGKDMMHMIESVQPGVRVLYMSGYTSDIISQKGVLEEKVDFIHKPFDIRTLNNAIQKVLLRK